MLRRLDGRVSLQDLAIGTDQVADAFCLARIGIGCGTVSDGHRQVLSAEQVKREVLFLLETFVLRWWIVADANDDGVLVCKLLDSITEPLTLAGSARCAGAGVEPEDDVLALVVGQRHGVTVLVGQAEGRCCIANTEHGVLHGGWPILVANSSKSD